ncbi:uncharacterized protein F5Z01DRAFT_477521 [Emericellopsis atlantica]|uniref:Uncharacterized protein n=1 Tax=Emericellopsis atlantica TaxID=2614577 RepID=A0A9P7ZRZ6_9HYPO|nr:uncharacterized protein F5Z01DRAFT_477521 [Emericellopsis atlantica]KAG9256563.1 hypothetical protein F5Z01DRAFT_477521 [Emericellopsis atlantica]
MPSPPPRTARSTRSSPSMPSSAAPEAAPSHACHCGKVFLRKEHLRRHQATHSQPSFQCPTCGRSFTRNDVLKRHLVVHASRNGKGSAKSWRACDACHENKTKCDGGTPCGFCVKKDLRCTTDRPGKDDLTRSHESEATGNLATETPVQQEGRDERASEPVSQDADREPLDQSFVEQGIAQAGLSCILKAVSSISAGVEWTPESRPHERYDEWMSCCLDQYLGRFHERWPVVHSPTFDRTTDNALLVSSMTMVGSWYHDGLLVKDSLIAINDKITSHVTKLLANDDLDESKAWPFETYQIGLLNIIFAFETGQRWQFAPARRLLNLILNSFRHRRIFDPDSLENHRKVHHPGKFEPWVHNQRSQWKNLSAVAFKIDTYFALLFKDPRILHAEEIELSLPCTFASENAAGIVRFFQRLKREPPEREHITVADYVLYPERFEEQMSHTALEDINLGLLGCYRDIWRHMQNRRSHCQIRMVLAGPLSERLELWKSKLDTISRTLGGASNTDDTDNAVRSLAMSYLCLEEPGDPGWEASVLARMAAHFMNATMLYHMLHMHLRMDGRVVYAFAIGRWSLGNTAHVPQSLFNTAALQVWARLPPGRAAVVQALLALRSYENGAAMTAGGINLCSDPIAHVTLATAGMVLRAWFQGRDVGCWCCPDNTMALPELNLDDAHGWIEHGVSVAVAGVALCRCQWTYWMGRCVEALVKGAALWELRADVIEALQKPIPSCSLDSA